MTSLTKAMTVSSYAFKKDLPTSIGKRLIRKISCRSLKRKDRKVKDTPKKEKQPPKVTAQQKANDSQNHIQKNGPQIIKTQTANCRIHSYDDNSHSVEIMRPHEHNIIGDGVVEKAEMVIVILSNGQTALFTSKLAKSSDEIKLFGP